MHLYWAYVYFIYFFIIQTPCRINVEVCHSVYADQRVRNNRKYWLSFANYLVFVLTQYESDTRRDNFGEIA